MCVDGAARPRAAWIVPAHQFLFLEVGDVEGALQAEDPMVELLIVAKMCAAKHAIAVGDEGRRSAESIRREVGEIAIVAAQTMPTCKPA